MDAELKEEINLVFDWVKEEIDDENWTMAEFWLNTIIILME